MAIDSARKYIGILERNLFFLQGLTWWISTSKNYKVTVGETTKDDFRLSLDNATRHPPEIILLGLDEQATDIRFFIKWLKDHHKSRKILGISTAPLEDTVVVSSFQAGLDGLVAPGSTPADLFYAFDAVLATGTYCPESVGKILRDWLSGPESDIQRAKAHLTDKQLQFLELVCKDLTYEQIAENMQMALNTVGNYRRYFFDLFNVGTRAGLMLQLIKRQWVKL